MTALQFITGQRWASELEPELGLGTVERVEHRNVKIFFPATGETRLYRREGAPLSRVVFDPGESVTLKTGEKIRIDSRTEDAGCMVYHAAGNEYHESLIDNKTAAGHLLEDFLQGQVGHVKDFSLRLTAWRHRSRHQAVPFWGFMGCRIELLPHQLYIGLAAAEANPVRFLLADEVGLGKTIEAGLVYHMLQTRGWVKRTLVLCPHPLVHQWLVEMYRRFNEMFTLLLPEHLKNANEVRKILGESQNIIASLDLLQADNEVVDSLVEAGWDLVVVDEAHHISWDPKGSRPEFDALKRFTDTAPHCLLLSATPLQLGEQGHFGRLHLLDPQRFHDYSRHLTDLKTYQEILPLINQLKDGELPSDTPRQLQQHFPEDKALHQLAEEAAAKKSPTRILEALIDRHGTGRMVYRNRRHVLKHFPGRKVQPQFLEWSAESLNFLAKNFKALDPGLRAAAEDPLLWTPTSFTDASVGGKDLKEFWMRDPRLLWLRDLMRRIPKSEKVLLLCHSEAMVRQLTDLLPSVFKVAFTYFHEGLPLTVRAKNAAYFSRPDGAKLLLSSEIGSEGRNFQFARHLVLMDIPASPGLLEQRIGRLHRIGQKHDVMIYPLVAPGLTAAVHFRWHREGLDSFTHPDLSHEHVYRQLKEELKTIAAAAYRLPPAAFPESPMADLVKRAGELARTTRETIESGRDRMLELHSFQEEKAARLAKDIHAYESKEDLRNFLEQVCEAYGLDFNPTVEKKGFQIFPGPEMTVDAFPSLPPNGLFVTLDRAQALVREDLHFMSWEHPLVEGAMDLILGENKNRACLALWPEAPERGCFFRFIYIVESLHPPRSGLPHFLPPTCLDLLLDLKGGFREDLLPALEKSHLKNGDWQQAAPLLDKSTVQELGKRAEELAVRQCESLADEARRRALSFFGSEGERLSSLPASVHRDKAHKKLRNDAEDTLKHLEEPQLRLDGVACLLAG